MNRLLLLFLLLLNLDIYSQVDSSKQDTTDFNLYPLPVVYYTPETRFAFGGVGICSFRFNGKLASERNSLFQLGGAYTQEDQLLFYLPYQLFLKDNQYNIFGEFGYYRYSYYFYGVGSELPESNEELYFVNYPRIRLNATKLVAKNFYAGFRYWFDEYNIKSVSQGGMLDNNQIVGAEGGTISSLGLIGLYDSRDNYNYPSKGSLLELLAIPDLYAFGSDFEFSRFSIDYSKYVEIAPKSILALNLFGVSILGEAPFNELAFIGGREKMRGYYEGRFRDKNLMMAQAEFRQKLFWKLGMVAFVGSGVVAPEINEFDVDHTKISGGLGLRYLLNQEDKINIRLDYGLGENGSSGFYLTIGEAF